MPKKAPAKRAKIYTEQIVMRCTPEQKERWGTLAAEAERDLGEWVRMVVDAATKTSKGK